MGVGVNTPTTLDRNSQIKGWDKKLQFKSMLRDIYSNSSGMYNTETKTMPNAIYVTVEKEALEGSVKATITMKKPLSASGVYGNDQLIGNEERPVTKSKTIFRNNFRKAVTTPGYGTRKLEAEAYKLYQRHVDDLGPFNQQQEGLEIRQAFVERFGESLVHGDTAADCVRNFNANIFVCGLPLRSASPTYSSSVATYTTNIVNRITAAGGGSILPTVGQTLNQPNLSNISNFALARRITPLSIPGLPGGKGYILTFSELQAAYIGDPAWSARNLGTLFKDRSALPDKVQSWDGVLGYYKDLLLVMDPLQPTLNPTGSSSPFGLSTGYVWPGDVDLRYRDDLDVCDTAFLHGVGSIVKWDAEKLHFIRQDDDYEIVQGRGTARVWGIQDPLFDQQTPNMGSWEKYNNVLVICRIPDYV